MGFRKSYLYVALLVITVIITVFVVNRLALLRSQVKPGQLVNLNKHDQNESANEIVEYKIEQVATGLRIPWGIVFTDQNRMIVTERPGQVREIVNGQLQSKAIHVFNSVPTTGEEGLMSVAKDPQYTSNKYLYFALAYQQNKALKVKIVRLTDFGSYLGEEQNILSDIPAAKYHAGCRIAFGPDNKLYITTGDATDGNIAQDLNSLGGKVLRINKDGSIPNDNPFPNSPVWSYGHRNGQGIAWHPENNKLYETEHGPSVFDGPAGGDEINLIEQGQNYGWPLVSHDKSKTGTVSPLLVYTPAEAPASAMFYSGKMFPQFKNNLFFGALKGEGIMRIVLDQKSPDKVLSYQKLGEIGYGRIREVVEGPNGEIYFSTSNTDGRGKTRSNDDKIFKIIAK